MSIKWNNHSSEQQLSRAPLPSSKGHLLVVRGFDSSGNVIVNDPVGRDDSQVRRVYRRDEFVRAWVRSGGVVYLIYPDNWSMPDPLTPGGVGRRRQAVQDVSLVVYCPFEVYLIFRSDV